MKTPLPRAQRLRLDREDKQALATVGGYALLALGACGALVVLSVVLALCVRIFVLVSGLGGI